MHHGCHHCRDSFLHLILSDVGIVVGAAIVFVRHAGYELVVDVRRTEGVGAEMTEALSSSAAKITVMPRTFPFA